MVSESASTVLSRVTTEVAHAELQQQKSRQFVHTLTQK